MDADELGLFERSLRDAAGRADGGDLDGALDTLGWDEALADDPSAAVTALFELQGATGSSSSALSGS